MNEQETAGRSPEAPGFGGSGARTARVNVRQAHYLEIIWRNIPHIIALPHQNLPLSRPWRLSFPGFSFLCYEVTNADGFCPNQQANVFLLAKGRERRRPIACALLVQAPRYRHEKPNIVIPQGPRVSLPKWIEARMIPMSCTKEHMHFCLYALSPHCPLEIAPASCNPLALALSTNWSLKESYVP